MVGVQGRTVVESHLSASVFHFVCFLIDYNAATGYVSTIAVTARGPVSLHFLHAKVILNSLAATNRWSYLPVIRVIFPSVGQCLDFSEDIVTRRHVELQGLRWSSPILLYVVRLQTSTGSGRVLGCNLTLLSAPP
ncbi:hypothetical protein RRG08_042391 [Elysia crispata]|uniref:Uncharacterized protein n=1 Tax=Elysia crispata TaxID=231223 RepID=A0AAE0ZC08_9GAST|nr:hypothetical protein RRG08_042391 [Elysia crispata]